MAVIQQKQSAVRNSVIQKGTFYTYNPQTFAQEHTVPFFHEVENPEDILRALDKTSIFSFDSETYTTGLKVGEQPTSIVRRWVGTGKEAHPQDFPFCMSFSDGVQCYTIYDDLDNRFAKFKRLRELLEDKTREKIVHNAKFDMHIAENIGIKLGGRIHDTIVLAKVANENRPSFELRKLAEPLPTGIVKFEYMVDAYKKTFKIGDYRKIPHQLLTAYANADVWNCFLVYNTEYPIIADNEQLTVYMNELDLLLAAYEMERVGMLANREYLQEQNVVMEKEKIAAEEEIYATAGKMFNINSGQQLYKALLDLGTDPRILPMTDKGNPKLDKKVLEMLAEDHEVPIVKKILEFRKIEKLHVTYVQGLLSQMDGGNVVHCGINQTEATTGRMSITKPALQTLPKKDKRIRSAFIPGDGYELWFMDLDQIEYRLFAHYAQAQGLIEAIKNGWDVHAATASILFNVPYEEVTEDQRAKAKTMNFALIYGQGLDALARSLKTTKSAAQRFRERYFAQIPEAEPFIQEVYKVTRARGYVRNFYGRRRHLNYDECYKAPNALIQGCAADYIKTKIVAIYKFLNAFEYETKMLIPVHDEVGFRVPTKELYLLPKLRWMLSDFETFRCPITAGVDKGCPSWGQKETIDIGFEPLTEKELTVVGKYDLVHRSAV